MLWGRDESTNFKSVILPNNFIIYTRLIYETVYVKDLGILRFNIFSLSSQSDLRKSGTWSLPCPWDTHLDLSGNKAGMQKPIPKQMIELSWLWLPLIPWLSWSLTVIPSSDILIKDLKATLQFKKLYFTADDVQEWY